LICFVYALTPLFILVSLIIVAARKAQNWSMPQFYNDIITISLSTCVFLYIVFLEKDVSVLAVITEQDFTSVFSLMSDILIFIIIHSWFLSRRSGAIPVFIRIMALGIIMYSIADAVYYYLLYKGLYIPNTLMDFVYALSLAVVAFGALLRTYKEGAGFEDIILSNIGSKKTFVVLLVYPIITAALAMTNAIGAAVDARDIATYLVIAIMHTALSKYIQLSAEYRKLLVHEQDINKTLGQRVDEKVRELMFLANHDTLTNLLNRRAFITYLEDTVRSNSQIKHPHKPVTLMFMDIDRFKSINDHYGHDIGDRVLIELSNRMREWNKYGATISRLGGDEFAVLLAGNYSREEIEEHCKELLALCNKPIALGEKTISVTSSIGIAMISEEARDINSLMKNADLAMYYAKAQGYNRYQFFHPILCREIDNKNRIAVMLNKPDVEKEFEMYYQPQFSLTDNRLVGAEALIRWNSAEYGYIPPDLFIPISEEIGYIHKIGKWVIQEAVKQAAKWNREDGPHKLKVGINISPKQIEDEGFIDILASIILTEAVKPACLDMEITENLILSKEEKIIKVFKFLKDAGFSISIDDFGSGNSALWYLSKYPFDRIKIDKSLVENTSRNNIKGLDVLKSIVSMAKSLGIITLAEGVETQEQLDILRQIGCEQAQGYLLGRPVPADMFEQIYLSGT